MPAPTAPSPRRPTEDDMQKLRWLRKALRLNLIQDRHVAISDIGETHRGDDVLVLALRDGYWTVSYVERGAEQAGSRCLFESVSDATKHVFWTMTQTSYPLNFQLDDANPKPY